MHRPISLTVAALFLTLPLAACTVNVRGDDDRKSEVDIRTPIGDISVRANAEDAADTGLAVYPRATRIEDDNEPGSADVQIGAFGFGLTVAAAKFESRDSEQAIVDFYTQDMKRYGTVTKCRGDVDFRGRTGPPTCKRERLAREVQLVAGTRDNQHIVAVKPRGSGSEIALVHVQTRGAD
jgi:hypothetical protein